MIHRVNSSYSLPLDAVEIYELIKAPWLNRKRMARILKCHFLTWFVNTSFGLYLEL